uniref:Beta-defensin n=1 Tax=Sus scrofa TaxID=9823 RepID=A0A8D0J9H1_PIG
YFLFLFCLFAVSWASPAAYGGSPEKCWNLHGSCRDKCSKNEKVYVFCVSGKLCCVKPKFQPNLFPKVN